MTAKGFAKHKDESSPYSPYSPDLAPSEFHIFGPKKGALRGRRFADNDELKHNVREDIRYFGKECRATGLQRLTKRWKKCVDNDGDFVEKQSQLCQGCTHDIRKCHYNRNYSF
jgi:hypothetical protein